MPIKILMPALSPTMIEGNLAKWLKKEGDKIAPGEVIAEIETDKATMEVEAVDEGILAKIIVSAGSENVAVGSVIAVILEEGEDASSLGAYDAQTAVHHDSSNIAEKSEAANKVIINGDALLYTKIDNQSINQPLEQNASQERRIFASPLAKRIATERNIDLKNTTGSGPHGRIIKIDLDNQQATITTQVNDKISNKNSSSSDYLNEYRHPEEYRTNNNSNIRKIIAKRLVESKQTVPHFYLSIECKMDKLFEARAELNLGFEDKDKKLSVNDFIALSCAKALRDVPEANSSWDESAIRYYNNVDISVAVAIEGGLITPIIRNADKKNIFNISKEVKELIKKAKNNSLSPEQFQGGGFTLSNLGMYGIKSFSAIINPPQGCILAVGESSRRPVVVAEQITIATIMDATLSCDHRVIDGAVGAKFLAAFKKYIESPILLLAN